MATYTHTDGGVLMPTAKLSQREARRATGSVLAQPRLGWWQDDADYYETDPLLVRPRLYQTFHNLRRRVPVAAAFTELFQSYIAQVQFTFEDDDERARASLGELLAPSSLRALSEGYLYGFSLVAWNIATSGWQVAGAWRLPQRTIPLVLKWKDNQPVTFLQFLEDGQQIPILREQTAYALKGQPPFGEGVFQNIADPGLQFIHNRQLLGFAGEVNLRNKPNWDIPPDVPGENNLLQAIQREQTNRNLKPNFVVGSSAVQVYQGAAGDDRPVATPKFVRTYPARANLLQNNLMMELHQQVAVVLGMESFLLGQGNVGSLALAQEQSGQFVHLVHGAVRMIRESLQEVLNLLYERQGFGEAPRIGNDNTAFIPKEDLAEVLTKLSSIGIDLTIESEAVRKVMASYGLPIEGIGDANDTDD